MSAGRLKRETDFTHPGIDSSSLHRGNDVRGVRRGLNGSDLQYVLANQLPSIIGLAYLGGNGLRNQDRSNIVRGDERSADSMDSLG